MCEKQNLIGYTKSKGLNYILLHLKKYNFLMNMFISRDLNLIQKTSIFLDFTGCILKYGVGINDYFQYNFYKRKAVDRASFIVARNRRAIIIKCNGSVTQPDFDDKSRFNKIFHEYLGRDWLDIDECTYQEFSNFIQKHSIFMCKIKNGSGGNGICMWTADIDHLEEDYKELRKKHVILEEVLIQHAELSKINPVSVNTLRIITLVTSTGVKVMNAVFRCGNGEGCTDNFHDMGWAALVDIETGMIITPAVNKLNHKVFVHPKTGSQIIGFCIPCWNEVVNTAKKAAMVRSDVRFVGWDIAILHDGSIAVVEGNCAADPDIIQMPDQIGKWPMYQDAIHQI